MEPPMRCLRWLGRLRVGQGEPDQGKALGFVLSLLTSSWVTPRQECFPIKSIVLIDASLRNHSGVLMNQLYGYRVTLCCSISDGAWLPDPCRCSGDLVVRMNWLLHWLPDDSVIICKVKSLLTRLICRHFSSRSRVCLRKGKDINFLDSSQSSNYVHYISLWLCVRLLFWGNRKQLEIQPGMTHSATQSIMWIVWSFEKWNRKVRYARYAKTSSLLQSLC